MMPTATPSFPHRFRIALAIAATLAVAGTIVIIVTGLYTMHREALRPNAKA